MLKKGLLLEAESLSAAKMEEASQSNVPTLLSWQDEVAGNVEDGEEW